MRKLLLLIFLCGCSTVATQSDDLLTLKIRGHGKAKFDNGASIERKSILPKLPPIKLKIED